MEPWYGRTDVVSLIDGTELREREKKLERGERREGGGERGLHGWLCDIWSVCVVVFRYDVDRGPWVDADPRRGAGAGASGRRWMIEGSDHILTLRSFCQQKRAFIALPRLADSHCEHYETVDTMRMVYNSSPSRPGKAS